MDFREDFSSFFSRLSVVKTTKKHHYHSLSLL